MNCPMLFRIPYLKRIIAPIVRAREARSDSMEE